MDSLFDPERVYRLSEVADTLQVSSVTLLRAAQRGDLRAFRVGHQWRVTGQEVISFMGRRATLKTGHFLTG